MSKGREVTIKALQEKLKIVTDKNLNLIKETLDPLFKDETEYKEFLFKHGKMSAQKVKLKDANGDLFLGIDAGSTTTKAVLIDKNKSILYSHFGSNQGNPLKSTIDILKIFTQKFLQVRVYPGRALQDMESL